MNKLKVCFIGIGSIAKRHIRNLRSICEEEGRELHIDAYRREDIPTEGVDSVFVSVEMMPNDYDAIFITNPTNRHLETLQLFHNKGKHFFIEKPAVSLDQINGAYNFMTREKSVYYVAAPLRYNAAIQWIKKNIKPVDVISVRSISSSYLPDWRPGQDYRETYSAHKDMGGGVSIDLIHEWDYLTYLFGWPNEVHSLIGKKSNLDIDSDDYAIYIAEYSDKVMELHLDYFGRKAIRSAMLFTKEDTILCDILNNRIEFLTSGETIEFSEERDDYQKRELRSFLGMITERGHDYNYFDHGLRVLELTQGKIPCDNRSNAIALSSRF